MAKFVMECPNCGNYVEASSGLFGTGFLAKKSVTCSCKHTFEVKPNKLTTRTCVKCGNQVVFDQSKGHKAKCPFCHEPINELEDQTKIEEISCAQCGIRLMAQKNARTVTCPVCDFVTDVQKALAQEHIKKEGQATLIKYEGDNETFIWKHPIEDFNMGSQLIVHESQEAVFFLNGDIYDGEYNGQGTFYYADGSSWTGTWKDDKRLDGNGTVKYDSGDYYIGEYKNGVREGNGKYFFADGRTYEGECHNDKWNGRGIFTFPDGRKYEGEFKDDHYAGKVHSIIPTAVHGQVLGKMIKNLKETAP